MTIQNNIKNQKLEYDYNREVKKLSALLSSKIGKYEYLTGEEILPLDQNKMIGQATFIYSPLGVKKE